MATQQQAINYINGGWRSSPNAKNEPAGGGLGIDVDNSYGFQCKDLLNDFALRMDSKFPTGNAIVLQQGAPAGWAYYSSPQPGDVALRDYYSGGKNYGDGVLVAAVSGGKVITLGQNQTQVSLTHGHVPTTATYATSAFKTYLRRIYDAPVAPPTPAHPGMPAVGSRIQLIAPITRTTYHAGTSSQAGVIHATNDQFVYQVRGYDPVYPGRIIINTASGGGNGVALALFYTSGTNIGGWKQV